MLKSEHSIEYTIITDDYSYQYDIKENYIRNEDYELYYIDIYDQYNHYILTIDNKFNKQKNIIKEINMYENNNIKCMVAQLVNGDYSEPMCIKNDKLYSYLSVKNEINIDELDEYITKYEESKEDNKQGKYNIIANVDYFDNDEYLVVYNLKNFVLITKDNTSSVLFGTKDNYQNDYGIMINQFYVIPSILEKPDINTFVIHNVEKNKTENLTIQTPISKNSYYNGIYNGELYITDKSNTKQYRLNPAKRTFELIADEEHENDAVVVVDGEAENISIYKLVDKEEVHFTNSDDALYKDIKADEIFANEIFAYYEKNGKFYKVYEKYKDYPIFLFEANDPKNIVVRKENIYFIDGSKLYKYNNKGLNVLIDYEEFQFNYKNIFDVYYK